MKACKKTWFRFNRKHKYEEDKSATSSGVSSSESGFKTSTVNIVNRDPAGDKTRLAVFENEKKACIVECCVHLCLCLIPCVSMISVL